MLTFENYVFLSDLMEDFDKVLEGRATLTEADFSDLGLAKVIEQGLDTIELPSIKAIIGAIAGVAKTAGAKASDLIKLFSKEGIAKVKGVLQSFMDTAEMKYLIRKFDKNRYKGFKGLEQYIADMKEENPTIVDKLQELVQKIVA